MNSKSYGLLRKIEKIKRESEELKQRYSFYQKKMINISRNALTPNKETSISFDSPNFSKKQVLTRALQKLDLIKQEKNHFLSNLSPKFTERSFEDLVYQKKKIQEHIEKLIEENEKLKNENKSLRKKKQKDKNFQEIYAEFLDLKKNVNDLELQHEKNLEILKELNQQLGIKFDIDKKEGLYEKKSEQKKENLEEKEVTDYEEVYKKLLRKYKLLRKVYKTQGIKLEQEYKKYEEIDKKLVEDRICLQVKMLKVKQQERLLEVTNNQMPHSTSPQNYVDSSYLYKPNIKNLYNLA